MRRLYERISKWIEAVCACVRECWNARRWRKISTNPLGWLEGNWAGKSDVGYGPRRRSIHRISICAASIVYAYIPEWTTRYATIYYFRWELSSYRSIRDIFRNGISFHFVSKYIYIYSYNKSRNIALRWQCSVFHSEFIGSRVINNVYTSFPRLIRKNWRELRIFPYLLFPEIFLDRYPSRSSNSCHNKIYSLFRKVENFRWKIVTELHLVSPLKSSLFAFDSPNIWGRIYLSCIKHCWKKSPFYLERTIFR